MRIACRFMAYNVWGFPIGEFIVALNKMPSDEWLCRYADKELKGDYVDRVEYLGRLKITKVFCNYGFFN